MTRLGAARRGYDSRWRIRRAHYLQQHPLCVMCNVAGRVAAATIVDHIVPHKGDQRLFNDTNNWQSLCKPCHDRHKQRIESRGYDNTVDPSTGLYRDPKHPSNAR